MTTAKISDETAAGRQMTCFPSSYLLIIFTIIQEYKRKLSLINNFHGSEFTCYAGIQLIGYQLCALKLMTMQQGTIILPKHQMKE